MADYDLKYTGQQIDALLDAANELKTNGYIYKGVATPSTNPGTPTERVAYLASEPGTYTNFGGIVITSGLYSLTYAGGTWTGTQMSAGSDIEVVQTTGQSASDVMSQKAVTDSLVGSAIAYNNLQSELAAENVQGALDEVAGAISTNMADADLDIGDKNGNILARFVDGGIQTKGFNSSLTPKQGEGAVGDLEIMDENNYVLARFYDGHIKTKYFDSKEDGMKSVYNVLSMGAVGDGEADDTIAIQNTLERGGLIIFPSGLYLISSPLIFKSNTTILMSEGAEIKQTGTSATCVLRSYSELTDTGYNGVHDVHIIGGCINANGYTTYPRSCIAMIHVKDIIFEGVTFKGQSKGMHSVDFAAGKNVKFKDCIFTGIVTINSWGECIQIDGANSTTSYPYLSDIGATDNSQIFDDVGCEFIEICGCTFYLNGYSPAIGNHNYSIHKNILIHDNTIIGLGVNVTTLDRGAISFNIWSGYPNQHNQSDMIFIHHNIIDGCYYGFSFDDGSDKHIYIRDNMLTECGNILKSNSPCAILLNNIENN